MRPLEDHTRFADVLRTEILSAAHERLVETGQTNALLRSAGMDPRHLDRRRAAFLQSLELRRAPLHVFACLGRFVKTSFDDLATVLRAPLSFMDGHELDDQALGHTLGGALRTSPLAFRGSPVEQAPERKLDLLVWSRNLLQPAPCEFAIPAPFRIERTNGETRLVGTLDVHSTEFERWQLLVSLRVPLVNQGVEGRLAHVTTLRAMPEGHGRAVFQDVLGKAIDVPDGELDTNLLLFCLFPPCEAGALSEGGSNV